MNVLTASIVDLLDLGEAGHGQEAIPGLDDALCVREQAVCLSNRILAARQKLIPAD